jgi:hypothetical protein
LLLSPEYDESNWRESATKVEALAELHPLGITTTAPQIRFLAIGK